MHGRTLAILLLWLMPCYAHAQSAADEVASIRRAIQRIKDSADHRWEQIPWVPTLMEARKISEREKRPIFLFTQEGNIRSGRC